MIIEKVSSGKRDQFRLKLESMTSSLYGRGISFKISTQSEFLANIIIVVTGKKGSVEKTFTIMFNHKTEQWEGYSDLYSYICEDISEFKTVIKTICTKVGAMLGKI